jgi:Flp pilus assembly protein TadD
MPKTLVRAERMNYSVPDCMTRNVTISSHFGPVSHDKFSSWPDRKGASGRSHGGSWLRQAGYSRETVLLSCFGLMLVLFVLTAFVARMYHKQVHVLGDQWFGTGEAAFRAGDAEDAAKDYRNALVYSPGNAVFQLHLAQALTAAGKDNQARSYLLNLLTESPGSGEINLELARISARSNEKASTQDALRYYYGAIYGVWDTNPIQMRWDAHRELCEYLLAQGMDQQAQSEIISLTQDVPPGDVARQEQSGALLMRAKLWNRALEEYRAVLLTHKRDETALASAGAAAFQADQYGLAFHYFDQLSPNERKNPQVSAMFETAREIQATSPFLPGLANQERARRTERALARAQALLQDCLQRQNAQSTLSNALQQLRASFNQNSAKWKELSLARHPDAVEAAMTWVFQVEDTVAEACGESPNPIDRALLLIAQSRPSPQQ